MADNFRNPTGNVASTDTILLTPHASRSRTQGVGEGDSDVILGAGRHNKNKPRIRKFGNGVHVPVFYEASEDGVDINGNPGSHTSTGSPPPAWSGKFPDLNSNDATDLMELFKCTICQDYMVEATGASCGHTFCSACLDSWTKFKPICPICSKRVSCKIRLYNEDLLIEKMVNRCDDFPQEIARRLYQASKFRMDRQQHSRSSLLGRLRERMDDFTNSLACKGFWQCFKDSGPCRAMTRYWSQTQAQPEVSGVQTIPSSRYGLKFGIIIGLIIGAILMWCYFQLGEGEGDGKISFLSYLHICIKNYDGSIPQFQSKSPVDEDELGGNKTSWWNGITKLFLM